MAAVTEQQLDWQNVTITILLADNYDQSLCLIYILSIHFISVHTTAEFPGIGLTCDGTLQPYHGKVSFCYTVTGGRILHIFVEITK